MKLFKFFMSAAMIAIATTASAQFANNGSSKGGGFSAGSASTDDYSRFKVSYIVATPSLDTHYSYDVESLNGVSVEYLFGKNIVQNMPVFLEYGINATWGMHTESDDYYSDYDVTQNYLNITVPINIAYKLALNDDLTIEPHVGVGARFNALGTLSCDGESISYFDKKDVGKDATWNRFQITGQAGIGICIQQYYLGWEYSWNFMELAKKTKMNTHYISFGINF